ncbi:MAG: [Fe-S]-binding protein [Bacteroidetes bacterium 47-18]|nr:MAG: [Fe-S]-binding protein [Bacteroidetes bacterium 47-18]
MDTTTKGVSFTDTALEEVKKLMQQPDFETGHVLRVGVKGGGCSGLSYIIGFDRQEEDDLFFNIQEVPVVIKKAHLMYLQDMQIDYGKGLDARGFIFNNPNASSTCGCGTSFAV